MSENEIIEDPPDGWVGLLRRGHKIWLVKEKQYVVVEFPHDETTDRLLTGKIGIFRGDGQFQSWFVTRSGLGLDGSLLMLPTNDLSDLIAAYRVHED